jgi:hypothetical protein
VAKRLDWARAFDLDGDGQFDDALNPGALLPVPTDLTIDFASSLQLRLSGTLTGTGVVGTNVDLIPDNAILTLGPLQVTGTAGFALTMSSVDADLDGNGTADLIGATLTGLALDVTNAGVNITGVATLTVSGQLALAMLKPAVNVVSPDTRSWFGLKMGDVTVAGGLDPSLGIQLSATIAIGSFDYNSASSTNPLQVAKRLDWARAFDLDGDGQFDDALNPGALLPVPTDLTIDFASSLQLRLSGTLTGTGVVGTNVDLIPDNAILTLGPLQVTGTAGFALTMSSVDADLDGNGTADLIGATLTGLALDVTNAGVNITGVATLTVSGQLALAMLKPAVNVVSPDTRSWFGLKMGDVTVAGGWIRRLGFSSRRRSRSARSITTVRPAPIRCRWRSGWTGRARSIWMATGSLMMR